MPGAVLKASYVQILLLLTTVIWVGSIIIPNLEAEA